MIATVLTGALVLLSLVLVIIIPVALATPGEWEASKNVYTRGFQIWVSLVIVIAAADGIAAAI